MKRKYEAGDIVFAKSNPGLKLIVCETFVGYYCKELEGPVRPPQIRFEKELLKHEGLLTPSRTEPFALKIIGDTVMKIWKRKIARVEN